jgi:hypothetical protein
MVAKRRLLASLVIGTGIAFAACSLITDVDRSKIEGAGGAQDILDDSGTETGGHGNAATGGANSVDGGGDEPDAAAHDASTN